MMIIPKPEHKFAQVCCTHLACTPTALHLQNYSNSDKKKPQSPTDTHKMRSWQKILSVILNLAGFIVNIHTTSKILTLNDLKKPLCFELLTHGILSIVSLSMVILSQVSGVVFEQSLIPCNLGYCAGIVG